MMRPLVRLVSHEWTLQRRNGVVRILLAAFFIVVGLTIVFAAARVERSNRDARLLAEANAAVVPERGAEYLANQHGAFAVLPPAPLSTLAVGQSDVHPSHYRITSRMRDAQLSGDQLEHPMMLHARHLDLAFVMLYLYSLVIIGLSYDILASERENGTLRLLLVQGATPSTLAMGKTAATLLFVIVVPVAAALLTWAIVGASVDQLPRLVLWMIICVSYGLFWLGLSAHVNARGRPAATNALTLAGLWLTLVVVAPAVGNLATRTVFPVPSGVQLDIAMREATRAAVAEGSRMLGRFLEDHPATGIGEEGMQQYYALQEARDRQVAASLRPLLDTFAAQRAEQARAMSVLQFTSPTIVAQMLLTDAAGTSGHRARHFAAQATRFQESWRAHFTPAVLSAGGAAPPAPVFEFDEEPMADVIARTAGPTIILLGASVVLLWSGIRRFARYQVTEAAWSR
jgi:ABC-2 type transport system permease protein